MDFQQLFNRLKTLQDLESNEDLYDLRPHRVRAEIRDPKQLVFAALCQVEILRLSAPEIPWSGRDLDGTFAMFPEAIDLLHSASTQPDIVSAVTDLLSKMTQLQIAGCIGNLNDSEKFVVETFDAAYRATHANTSSRIRYLICQFLSQIIDELEYNIPDDAVCLLLDQFNGEAASLSREICQNCPKIDERVKQFFLELLEDRNADDRFEQAAELAKGVIEHSFPVFEPSLHLFVKCLEMLQPEARVMAVKVIGWVELSQNSTHNLEFERWVKRSLDASAAVRVAWAHAAASCLSRPSVAEDYTNVWEAFLRCFNDPDAKVRAAAAEALGLLSDLPETPKPLESMLAPRLRDKSAVVQSKALETALELYKVSACEWVPRAFMNLVYVYDQKGLDLLWGATVEMLGITSISSPTSARSIAQALSRLDLKSTKAFSALYRNHLAISKALSRFVESEASEHNALAEWISNLTFDTRLKTQLLSLDDEQRSVLKLAIGPLPTNEAYKKSQSSLHKSIATLVIKYGCYLEQNTPYLIDLLDDSQLGKAAETLLSEIALGTPETVAKHSDQLLKKVGQNDKALPILSIIADHIEGELNTDETLWQHVEAKVFSKDVALAQHAVKMIALLGPRDLLVAITNEVMAMVLESPSASALSALNTLYAESPNTILSHVDASLVPQQLVKIIQSKGKDDLRCLAMNALVARLNAVASGSSSSTNKAEPVLKLFRKLLDDKTLRGKILDEAAALWFRLASVYGKQTGFADVVMLNQIFSANMAASLIKELRNNQLSLIYSPLLFLDEKVFPLVQVGMPTLEKSDHDVGMMVAYLIYYLAAESHDLDASANALKRFCWAAVTRNNIEVVYHVATRIKQFRDVRDPPAAPDLEPTQNSKRLYAVSELAIEILEHYRQSAGLIYNATISKPMALPRKVYQSSSSAAASQLVAETSYLSELGSPEEVAKACEDLRKRSRASGITQGKVKVKRQKPQQLATPEKQITAI